MVMPNRSELAVCVRPFMDGFDRHTLLAQFLTCVRAAADTDGMTARLWVAAAGGYENISCLLAAGDHPGGGAAVAALTVTGSAGGGVLQVLPAGGRLALHLLQLGQYLAAEQQGRQARGRP